MSVGGRVRHLALDDYVARVVAGEGQPHAVAAAHEALAITARTFALANRNRHRREGFDLCDTTHCQVTRPATAASIAAARATTGLVLTHGGRPASVFYSALCGGHSELASHVWPGADDTASHLQEDDACRDEPGWTMDVKAGDIERALRGLGHRGRLRDLRVVQRNASGRASRVRVDGLSPNELSGHEFRTAMARQLGYRAFRSTAFDVRRRGSIYRFTGTGFGHGVGLCVIGAGNRGAGGATAEQILAFYFPKLSIGPAIRATRRDGRAAAPSASSVAAAKTAPITTDVALEIPPVEAPERREILSLVRAARDQIAKSAGVAAPGAIRVTIHPSVDAFAQATGQPWWVSGAAAAARIDLVPVAVLRQRAQLELTIRREVARLLTEPALRDRPMWVREGAVAYFAEPLVQAVRSAARCPGDEELLRPISAGAHRSALERAEACFRSEIARGRLWRQVR